MSIQMKRIVGVLALAASILAPVTAVRAEGPPKEAALPTSVAPPPAGKGEARSAIGLDIAALGYVEEEFLVSGKANVYEYDANGAVVVKTPNVDYTTRIMVRRPTDPKKFSGTVRFETSHPQYGFDFVWQRTVDYVIANGDVVVSVAMRRGETSPIEAMKRADPVRYEAINFAESGLNWDIIGQVGRLVKTKMPANPLNAYDVKRVHAQGWSGGAALLLIYISEGFHERTRMPGGGPIIDAYMVGEPSGYPQINSTTPALPTSDKRQQVQAIDVPAISLHTRAQEQHRRRSDSDRYRVYEIAAGAHNNRRLPLIYKQTGDVFKGTCVHEISRFPMHHFFKSTLTRLDAWAARGVTPPPSQRFALKADGTPELDQQGNYVGGVRSTYVDVPTARYFTNAPAPDGGSTACNQDGAQERFTPEKLKALYKDRRAYADKVASRTKELEKAGWILPVDAEEVRKEATNFGGF